MDVYPLTTPGSNARRVARTLTVIMSGQRYTPEFKDEAVKQVIDRGYTIAEVSESPRFP